MREGHERACILIISYKSYATYHAVISYMSYPSDHAHQTIHVISTIPYMSYSPCHAQPTTLWLSLCNRLFICFSQVVLALTPRLSSSLFAQISFRKRFGIFLLSLGSRFPSLNMRRLYQFSCWFFYRFQHRCQVLRSLTRCLTGRHQAKFALCQWTVTC